MKSPVALPRLVLMLWVDFTAHPHVRCGGWGCASLHEGLIMTTLKQMTRGLLASACLLCVTQAYAQDGGQVLRQELSEAQTKAVAGKAIPAEKRLPALPKEAFEQAPPASKNLPETIGGNPGGKVIRLPDVETAPTEGGGPEGRNYGLNNLNTVYHYNDHRIDPVSVPNTPHRQSGYFLHTFNGTNFFYCTATLISRSILVTAGHCVYDTNANKYITSGTFTPACVNCNGGGTVSAPYGKATANYVLASAGWRAAASESAALDKGVDVAVVVLNKKTGTTSELGASTGWQGFCATNCLQPYWQLSQLGYPSNYDGGNRMNYGEHIEKSDTRDFLLGSGMQGGSSGGPHIANIGDLSDSSTNKGQFASRNWIFAVTSWGYTDTSIKIQGASPLSGPNNTNNFKSMFNTACSRARTLHGTASCTLLP